MQNGLKDLDYQQRRHLVSMGIDCADLDAWMAWSAFKSANRYKAVSERDWELAVELNEKTSGGFVHFESPVRAQPNGAYDKTDNREAQAARRVAAGNRVYGQYDELLFKLPPPWGTHAFIAATSLSRIHPAWGLPAILHDMLKSIDVVRQIEVRHAGGVTHIYSTDGEVRLPYDIPIGTPVELRYTIEVPHKRRDNGKGRNKRRGRS